MGVRFWLLAWQYSWSFVVMAHFTHYRVNNDEQIPIMKDAVDVEPGCFIPNLRQTMRINILSLADDEIMFDLIGVDASIANALRRILLAEVCFLIRDLHSLRFNNRNLIHVGSNDCRRDSVHTI